MSGEAEPGPGGQRFTLMLVPEGGGGRIRQLSFTLAQARRAAIGLSVTLLLASLSLVLLVWAPGPAGGGGEEEARLRGQLQSVEQRMEEVDRELRRIRLHRDQLRQDAISGFGPLDDDEVALALAEMDEPLGEPPPAPPVQGASPAELLRRADRLLRRALRVEEELGVLAEDALGAWERPGSVPSTWPLLGVLTSGFGWRRSPFTRQWKFHFGLDIAAERGTLIVAPAAGEVIYADWDRGYGRLVEIDHGGGVVTRYGHNAQLFVADGDLVQAGQAISTVGMTGMTTGPHLHYEIYVDGAPVDPLEHLE
jgi:murein DD-endopeptidase MepM/ murein hydrolase activator NlpD